MSQACAKKSIGSLKVNKKVNENGPGVEKVDLLRKMLKFCNPTMEGLFVNYINEMMNAVWAFFWYCTCSDEHPHHEDCPSAREDLV